MPINSGEATRSDIFLLMKVVKILNACEALELLPFVDIKANIYAFLLILGFPSTSLEISNDSSMS